MKLNRNVPLRMIADTTKRVSEPPAKVGPLIDKAVNAAKAAQNLAKNGGC